MNINDTINDPQQQQALTEVIKILQSGAKGLSTLRRQYNIPDDEMAKILSAVNPGTKPSEITGKDPAREAYRDKIIAALRRLLSNSESADFPLLSAKIRQEIILGTAVTSQLLGDLRKLYRLERQEDGYGIPGFPAGGGALLASHIHPDPNLPNKKHHTPDLHSPATDRA
jgi:hypothetical protein